MSTRVYNFTNQRLVADKLREVEAFNSYNFGGVISKDFSSPFSISGNAVTLSASEANPVTFFGGGVLLNQVTEEVGVLPSNNTLWYLEVTLDPSASSIISDELIDIVTQESKVLFKTTSCSELNADDTYTYYTPVLEASGNPSVNQYYEYDDGTYTLSIDDVVESGKQYYSKIEATRILFKAPSISTSTFSYFGNTLWVNDRTFIIPLFVRLNNSYIQTVVVRDLSNVEGLMSMDAYSRLKSYVDGTFVWSSGGEEQVIAPDGTVHKKGDIGNLNITADTISNNINSNPVKVQNLTLNNLASADNDIHTKLVVDSSGNISAKRDYVQSVEHGGTGATNRNESKRNLGIYYGTTNPIDGSPVLSPQEGDIYLWIIE